MNEKLHFVFKDNNKFIYDEYCVFIKENNKVKFSYNNEDFSIEYDRKKIKFIRETENSVFILDSDLSNHHSSVYLKDQNIEFEIKVVFLEYYYGDNYLEINYILESDEKSKKRLIIRY